MLYIKFGGEGGIRTLEGLQTLAGFQDQCIRPLCHLSRDTFVMRRRILLAACIAFNWTLPKCRIEAIFAIMFKKRGHSHHVVANDALPHGSEMTS